MNSFFCTIRGSGVNFAETNLQIVMNRLKLTYLILAILLPLFAATAMAQSSYSLSVVKVPSTSEPEKNDIPQHGHRTPGCPIEAIISLGGGVEIQGIDSADILSYEVCDEEGVCLASFADESDFTGFLFSNAGAYMVRFITDDYIYIGYVEIE